MSSTIFCRIKTIIKINPRLICTEYVLLFHHVTLPDSTVADYNFWTKIQFKRVTVTRRSTTEMCLKRLTKDLKDI